MIAAYSADLYTVALLIHYGANVNAETDFSGWKVCDVAMLANDCVMENFLMDLDSVSEGGYFMII